MKKLSVVLTLILMLTACTANVNSNENKKNLQRLLLRMGKLKLIMI